MFAITSLGDRGIYLGYDWLQFHNPSIDWAGKLLYFNHCPYRSCGYVTKTIIPEDDEEEVEYEKVKAEAAGKKAARDKDGV